MKMRIPATASKLPVGLLMAVSRMLNRAFSRVERRRNWLLVERMVSLGLNFDVFRLRQLLAPQDVLMEVTEVIMDKHGLLDTFQIRPATFRCFMKDLNQLYRAGNPYHNPTHVTDMQQTLDVLVCSVKGITLTPTQLLTLFLAAACHGVEHPGLSNTFFVKARDEVKKATGNASAAMQQAADYARVAESAGAGANEWHHADVGWQLVMKHGLLDALDAAGKAEVERTFKAIILATDMAQHEPVLEAFKAAVTNPAASGSLLAIMAGLLHIADISNPCRPPEVALRLGNGVMLEMLAQGEAEQQMFGTVVSPLFMCSPKHVNTPQGQIGFVNKFITTTLDYLELLCPDVAAEARSNLATNLGVWGRLQQAGMVLPLPDAARTVEQFVQEVEQLSYAAKQQQMPEGQQQQQPQQLEAVVKQTEIAEQLSMSVVDEADAAIVVSRSSSLIVKNCGS